jgi:hypothetical protein
MMHNEVLADILGVNTEKVHMVEKAILRPKKRNFTE